MITFDFYCPACGRPANATADPVDLLFAGMGKAELFITCMACDTRFKADVVQPVRGAQLSELQQQENPDE